MARLPLSLPTEQIYRSHVPAQYQGLTAEKYFAARFDYLGEEEWARRLRSGQVTVNGQTVGPGHVVRERDVVVTRMGFRTEPPADLRLRLVYEDSFVRVFNKGAPLPVHPSGRYFKNSMTELLKERYPDEVPRPVQRLDATTTGLIVFARTREAAASLMFEFQENRVYKEYLALVEGIPREKRFVVNAPIGKIKGSIRGVGNHALRPKPAVTEVEWLGSRNGRSLLKVIPRSGRTNQIRVHLSIKGLPVVNDPVYGKGHEPGCEFGLHAFQLRFRCLDRGMELTAACPAHFKPFLESRD